MDEEIDRFVVSVRADTATFARDVSAMRGELEGPLVAGAGRAGRMIDNALAKAITTGKVGFDDLKRVALSAMAEIAQASLRSLFNSSGGAGSGSFGAGLLNGLGSLITGLLGSPGRATGGPVSAARGYVVGEHGPELFVPTSGGRIERLSNGGSRDGACGHCDSGAGAVRPASAAAIEPPSRPGDPLCAGGAAMKHSFTSPDAPIVQTYVKRFDPLHWTVDFPRGTIASVVTTEDRHGVVVRVEFLRKGDLVGLIYESEDRLAHPAHARETNRDYSKCILTFHWQSTGVIALDQVNGPTLTIEGKDASGNPRSWFVRLWNYAQGMATNADVTLDFGALDGGYALPADADRVDARAIDRMFISLVAPGYLAGSQELFATPLQGIATITNIRCDG